MSVTNISQGGNKAIQILGLKELQAKVREIYDASVAEEAAAIMAVAALTVRDAIVQSATSVNLDEDALEDVYIYTRQPGGEGRRDSVTALAGLRKAGRQRDAHGYRTWYPSSQTGKFNKTERTRKKRGGLVLPGAKNAAGGLQKIGENVATMWEFGTTKLQPRPFFRPAISAVRNVVLGIIADGYRALLENHSA